MESNLNNSMDAELVQALLENHVLQEQIAMQTQFMHLLTHQLSTPLTSLGGSVHLLAEPALNSDQRQEFLTVVEQQVQRLEHLLRDLVAIRNLETGALETHAVSFCLSALVEEITVAFRPYPVIDTISPDLPPIWSDRWQISQVLVNLLSNAVKYSPDASPVEIGATVLSPGWVQVSVQDHGLGIPLTDQPRLFEQFYRVKHSDRQNIEGTGLGLSLCKLLVENQGGRLWFESTHGQGSCFYFTLPTADQHSEMGL
jgi:signal transduction histidine kinase